VGEVVVSGFAPSITILAKHAAIPALRSSRALKAGVSRRSNVQNAKRQPS
jgi:hypothetical protein